MNSRLTRREAIRHGASVALGSAAAMSLPVPALGQAGDETRPPNIIFILADDLGYGDLGCYGQERIRTPHLDRMAVEGVRFTDCYAGSTVCAPSRCCLMTGLHTGHCHVRGNARVPLRPEDVTVAEVLQQAGYATGIVGKWGLGEPDTTGIPNRQGFDYWFGYLNQRNAHNYYPSYLWRNEEKITLEGNLDGKREQYSHDLFTEEALQFVRRHAGGPFLLYLAYTIPHANNELGRETGDGMEVPDYGPYSDEAWPRQQKGHAAMITRLDSDIGRLLALLRQLGLDENTVVFFTSDNGPHREGGAKPGFFSSSGPLRGIKRDLYEGGIRVPTIARWPGRIAPNTTSDAVWSFWDFLPTAAELAGATPPEGLDGQSIVPALLGEPQRPPDHLYWEFHEGGFHQAIRHGNWKAVRLGTKKPVELYDLSADLGETTDLAERYPDVARRATELIERSHVDSKEFPVKEKT